MTTTDTTYNGWKNYETWCVSLWLDNDESTYHEVRDMARVEDPDGVYGLARDLAEYVDNLAEMTCEGCRSGASFVSDLVGAALSEVDWHEIAENLLTEVSDAEGR